MNTKQGDKRMNAIINTKLITEDGIIWDGAVTWEGKTIVQAGWRTDVDIPADADIIDAGGKYTAPGLILIHCHGYGDFYFFENPMYCAERFLQHGTTTILPTFYSNLSLEDMLAGIDRVRAASTEGAGRIIDGIYMEGPYMGGKGSYQSTMKWCGPILKEEFQPLVDYIGDDVRVWCIDPGRPGIEEFLDYARQVKPGVIFSMGHSESYASACRRIKNKYGIRNQTHHNDSGKAKGFCQGTFGAGCDEFTLYDPDIFAEIICDKNGIHVDPDIIKMVVRTKGVERIILITDSMTSRDNYKNAPEIGYGPDLNYDDIGYLAGSRLTLENACQNMMKHTGYGLCHAIRFATINPARMLGIDHKVGSLEPGKLANIILIDDMVHIDTVILQGDVMVRNA